MNPTFQEAHLPPANYEGAPQALNTLTEPVHKTLVSIKLLYSKIEFKSGEM